MRIVSLLSSATEILFGIGRGDSVVGISHECDYPASATNRPRVTKSLINSQLSSAAIDAEVQARFSAGDPLYELDRELLVRLAPDLVITQAQCDVCAVRYTDVVAAVRQSEQLKETKILSLAPNSLAEILEDVRRVGVAAQAKVEAERFRQSLLARVQRVRETAANIHARPTVVCIEWVEPMMLAANWTPELIDLAGGEAPLVKPGEHSGYIDWESVRTLNPDVVIISPCGFDLPRSQEAAESLRSLPGWNDIAAVRHQRTFVLDGNAYLNRSGPRIVDSLEIIAHFLHPERFAPVHHDAWVRIAP